MCPLSGCWWPRLLSHSYSAPQLSPPGSRACGCAPYKHFCFFSISACFFPVCPYGPRWGNTVVEMDSSTTVLENCLEPHPLGPVFLRETGGSKTCWKVFQTQSKLTFWNHFQNGLQPHFGDLFGTLLAVVGGVFWNVFEVFLGCGWFCCGSCFCVFGCRVVLLLLCLFVVVLWFGGFVVWVLFVVCVCGCVLGGVAFGVVVVWFC